MAGDSLVRITGRWRGAEPDATATLTLPWSLRQRSRFCARLDDGRDAGVWMPRGEVLRGGDRLFGEGGLCVEVRAAPEELAVARPKRPVDLARACYHLGNRHTPLQLDSDTIRFQPDHVLEHLLRSLGVPVRREPCPFDPEPGAYDRGSHAHAPSRAHPVREPAPPGPARGERPARRARPADGASDA